MLFTETIRVAFDALRANKMRSLLTMLGIVIGIGSVITMVALGNGAQAAIRERIARLGTTVLQINPARVQHGGVNQGVDAKITAKDVQFVVERAPNVVAITWQQDRSLQIVWKNKNSNVQVTGTTPSFLEVRGFKLAAGRMFTTADDAARRKLAVLGGDVPALFGLEDGQALIGETIRIAKRQFVVIGVLQSKGTTGFGDGDEQILVPFSTGRFELFGNDRLNDVWALASSEDSIPAAMAEIRSALRRAHKQRTEAADYFNIRNQTDFLQMMSETSETFGMLLAGIAAVSLLVGGIGIMNIMLVTVTERTREIGVRKALGATKQNILLQFLAEAVVLCLTGGAIGIGAGVFASARMSASMGWRTSIDPPSIAVAFGFATAIGVVFGVWPALRASKLDPIDALRFE